MKAGQISSVEINLKLSTDTSMFVTDGDSKAGIEPA